MTSGMVELSECVCNFTFENEDNGYRNVYFPNDFILSYYGAFPCHDISIDRLLIPLDPNKCYALVCWRPAALTGNNTRDFISLVLTREEVIHFLKLNCLPY